LLSLLENKCNLTKSHYPSKEYRYAGKKYENAAKKLEVSLNHCFHRLKTNVTKLLLTRKSRKLFQPSSHAPYEASESPLELLILTLTIYSYSYSSLTIASEEDWPGYTCPLDDVSHLNGKEDPKLIQGKRETKPG
jgi:hypothetical protein